MMLQYQLHKILLVAATMIMITSAMKCDKLILTSGSVENTGATSTTHLILETGQYLVTTTLYTRSSKIQKFIKRLNGASDIQYSAKSFTATLVPKDLKKVCFIEVSLRLLSVLVSTVMSQWPGGVYQDGQTDGHLLQVSESDQR